MISDEAVETAAKVYRDQQTELGYPKWEDLPKDGREWRRGYMRKALEAAAPHMLADAWEEGEFAGALNLAGEECPDTEPVTNPYRSQA